MNRSKLALGVAAAVSAVTFAGQRQASACGGCFQPPPPPNQTVSDITDERMLLSVSPGQSTLYDQITYSGAPSSFAWVLPIHGTVTVGLSADILFDSIDAVTKTVINQPPTNCPAPNCAFNGPTAEGLGSSSGGSSGSSSGGGPPPVTVLAQANVGPYATVQLKSTSSSALEAWLTQNGYNIPAAVQPILDAYVQEGSDFLAMKLLPNQGVQSMRPVRVTTPGSGLTLPLRMASIGTGAVTGITIWVVADGRYEPQNFPFFHIDDSQLVWDWSTNESNYTTLRLQQESTSKNAAWEIESSIAVNEQTIKNVILSGGRYYQNGLTSGVAVDASQDYLPVGSADAGAGYESADQVRDDDINTLLAGLTGPTVRITRIRSDVAQTAMANDFVLQASADQSELPNTRIVTKSVNLTCPIYNGCTVIGTGTLAQAQASVDAGTGGSASASGGGNGSGSSSAGATGSTSHAAGGASGGCAASAQSTGSGVTFGALAGMAGLVVGRLVRARRRRAR
jgi:hypothetical protein